VNFRDHRVRLCDGRAIVNASGRMPPLHLRARHRRGAGNPPGRAGNRRRSPSYRRLDRSPFLGDVESRAALVKFLGSLPCGRRRPRAVRKTAGGTRQCCSGYLGAYGRCGCPVYYYAGAPSYSEAVNPHPVRLGGCLQPNRQNSCTTDRIAIILPPREVYERCGAVFNDPRRPRDLQIAGRNNRSESVRCPGLV
jgi:hypothetical protein